MSIVITGNPVDGFTHYGPFADANEAGDWAHDELAADWWVATLHEVSA